MGVTIDELIRYAHAEARRACGLCALPARRPAQRRCRPRSLLSAFRATRGGASGKPTVFQHRLHRRCKPAPDALRRSAKVPSLSGAAGGGALRAPTRALPRGQAPEPGAQLRRQAGGAPGRRGRACDLQPSVWLGCRRSDRALVPRSLSRAGHRCHVCLPRCNAWIGSPGDRHSPESNAFMLPRPPTRRGLLACARRARGSPLLLCIALTLGQGAQEPPPHVPAWLPAFPDKHTCARTALVPCILGCLAAAADPAIKRVACTGQAVQRPATASRAQLLSAGPKSALALLVCTAGCCAAALARRGTPVRPCRVRADRAACAAPGVRHGRGRERGHGAAPRAGTCRRRCLRRTTRTRAGSGAPPTGRAARPSRRWCSCTGARCRRARTRAPPMRPPPQAPRPARPALARRAAARGGALRGRRGCPTRQRAAARRRRPARAPGSPTAGRAMQATAGTPTATPSWPRCSGRTGPCRGAGRGPGSGWTPAVLRARDGTQTRPRHAQLRACLTVRAAAVRSQRGHAGCQGASHAALQRAERARRRPRQACGVGLGRRRRALRAAAAAANGRRVPRGAERCGARRARGGRRRPARCGASMAGPVRHVTCAAARPRRGGPLSCSGRS